MKLLILVMIMSVISACGGIKQESILPLEDTPNPITLNSDYRFEVDVSLGSLFITLRNGQYKPIGRNAEGIFFVGPHNCLERDNGSNSYNQQCGLYLKEKNNHLVYFFYFETEFDTTNDPFNVSASLLEQQSKNFHIDVRHPIERVLLDATGL